MPVLLPPDYTDIPEQAAVVFLAGPIQGAPGWQEKAATLLLAERADLVIANPRRPSLNEDDFNHGVQVDWESYHLRRAATHGVVLFWCAAEVDHDCSRAYAQTTRFELAEWVTRHQYEGTKIVIGTEKGFSGERYICRRTRQDAPDIPLVKTLEDACRETLKLLASGPK